MNDLHFYSNIILQGKIQNIEYSHNSHDKKYYKAILLQEDHTYIPIKFIETVYDKIKQYSDNNQEVYLGGNIRLFNKQIYVYIKPNDFEFAFQDSGSVELFGQITKHDEKFGSYVVNCGNNSYIPVKYSGDMNINGNYVIEGKLKQRQYSKKDSTEIFYTYEVVAEQVYQK